MSGSKVSIAYNPFLSSGTLILIFGSKHTDSPVSLEDVSAQGKKMERHQTLLLGWEILKWIENVRTKLYIIIQLDILG